MLKLILAVCLMLLQACGSGGNSTTLGHISFTEGGAYIPVSAMNTGLLATKVSDADPNKSVTTSTTTYNLQWSTPDSNGPAYAHAYFDGSWKPSTHLQLAIGGNAVNQGDGTSYAAPRVAGYVAIVRSKFPNLSATNTASILLDTARYDTLECSKNGGVCDPKIYGKGEASLSRALAPVGKLK
jgi:subtilisin family serine protease